MKEVHLEADPNYEKMVSDGFNYLRNLVKTFTVADLPEKQRLFGSIFPEKLIFLNGKVRTNDEDNILMLLSLNYNGLRTKNKSSKKFLDDLTDWVGPTGLEPVTL